MENLTIKNKTELRNRIINCKGTTDSLNNVHFYVDGNEITWDIYGNNDNLNSVADDVVSLGYMDEKAEYSTQKSRNEAITKKFKELEQNLVIVYYADYSNIRVVKTNVGELSDWFECREELVLDDEYDFNGYGLAFVEKEDAIKNLAEKHEMTEEEKKEIEIVIGC